MIQSGLQELKKSYIMSDHVKKILRSLPARFRPKVITNNNARDLDTLRLKDIISSLKSHEIELVGGNSNEKYKPLVLIAKNKTAKALQTTESIQESFVKDSDNDSDIATTTHLTKRLQHLNEPSSRNNITNSSDIKDQNGSSSGSTKSLIFYLCIRKYRVSPIIRKSSI